MCACIPGRWFSLGYALLACTRSFVPTCARCTESAVTGEIERALPTVPSTMVQLQESYATGTTSRQPARPPFGTPPAAPTKPKRVWKQRANDSRGDANLFSLWSLSVSRDTRGERGERGVARVRIYRCGLRQHPDTAIVHYVSCRIAERRVVRGRCESKFKALSNVIFQDFTAHAPRSTIRLPS